MSRQSVAKAKAKANLGRFLRWPQESIWGWIIGVEVGRGGWPYYLVEWDDGAPDWWTRQVSAASNLIFDDARYQKARRR